jgi:hypothetical protein
MEQGGPLIGTVSKLPRRILLWRSAIALVLVFLLALAKLSVSRLAAGADAERQQGQALAAGLILGGPPTDFELEQLMSSVQVRGVINLGTPSIAEQVTADGLHLAYLYLDMPPEGFPARSQLHVLAGFIQKHTLRGDEVYMNDDGSGDLVLTTAAMLMVMRGWSWSSVSAHMTSTQLHSLSTSQVRAIQQLGSAGDEPVSQRDSGRHPSALRRS